MKPLLFQPPAALAPAGRELVVDSFAGGGGASLGIAMATGRAPDIAINHDAEALAMHRANHPETLHVSRNIWQVDPLEAVGNRPVGLAWFSPDCKHFSKAKGGRPVKRNIRDLAWVVVLWARRVRPRVICLENVEEFRDWGPVDQDGKPCAARRGETFARWLAELKRLGYRVEHRELRACDYGAPTIRKRLFLIARRDGRPIRWPEPTHGDPKSEAVKSGRLKPWRTAAEIIDWSLPCHSIFLTREEGRAVGVNRPLADATMRRIARGVKRYVLDAAEPFIVRTDMASAAGRNGVHGLDEPARTLTTGGSFACVAPYLVPRYGERPGQEPRTRSIEEPMATVVPTGNGGSLVAPIMASLAHGESGGRRCFPMEEPVGTIQPGGGKHALVSPVLVGCGGRAGQSRPRAGGEPLHTATAKADTCLAAVALTKFSENSTGQQPGEPLHTVMAGAPRHGVVAAFLAQHNGGMVGHEAGEPVSTVTQRGTQQALVASFLSHAYTSNTAGGNGDLNRPKKTVLAGGWHAAEVRAFLMKYYGADQDPRLEEPLHTATTKARFGLVMVEGQPYEIVDIGMRMLSPRELFRAQGFPDSYRIDAGPDGQALTKTAQIRMCGNSVCPPLAATIVAANYEAAPSEAAGEAAA